MVGDSVNHFSVEGGTLMLKPGAKAGNTFIATVEVRDKFSTLNPNYEDLATTVRITAVIIGCPTDEWTRNLAKAKFPRNSGDPPNQIAVESGAIKVGDVIARRYTENEYNHIVPVYSKCNCRQISSQDLYHNIAQFIWTF